MISSVCHSGFSDGCSGDQEEGFEGGIIMDRIQGIITRLRIYEEEGRTDWVIGLSRLIWFLIWVLLPLSLFRFLHDLMGVIEAVVGVFILFLFIRIIGPANLVMLDELLSRIIPSIRSPIRFGTVRVYDFRIRTDDGPIIPCLLRGDLVGASPMVGDLLQVEGVTRQGCFIVRRGCDLTTGAVLAPRITRRYWIFSITVGIAALFIFYLFGAFDNWIYEWVVELMNMFYGDQI